MIFVIYKNFNNINNQACLNVLRWLLPRSDGLPQLLFFHLLNLSFLICYNVQLQDTHVWIVIYEIVIVDRCSGVTQPLTCNTFDFKIASCCHGWIHSGWRQLWWTAIYDTYSPPAISVCCRSPKASTAIGWGGYQSLNFNRWKCRHKNGSGWNGGGMPVAERQPGPCTSQPPSWL